MNPPSSFVEADLHAFVDGETGERTTAEIGEHLSKATADLARVEAWRVQNEMIRAAFGRVPAEPLPVSLSLTPPPRIVASNACSILDRLPRVALPGQRARQMRLIGIAFFAGLAVASAVGLVARWVADDGRHAAAAQPAETPDVAVTTRTLAALRGSGAASPLALPSAERDADSALVLPNLARAGFTLISGHVSQGSLGPSACGIYANLIGKQVALCVERAARAAERVEETTFRSSDAASNRVVLWHEKNAIYALAGSLEAQDLSRLARRVHAETASR